MIRLDRFLREAGVLSRSEASKAIRARRVTVDGAVARDPSAHVEPTQTVALDGAFTGTRGDGRYLKRNRSSLI